MGRTADMQESLTTTEAHDMINVVSDYAYALDTLDRYDYEQLRVEATTQEEKFHATYEAAMDTIHTLRDKFGGSTLFGNEKDDSFKSSIGQIYQTFGGEELYPSVEEKAAMLLYLVTKNHSFSDGNKRIAATLFLWFMHSLQSRWVETHHRWHTRCPYPDDSRKPYRGEGRDGEGGGESHQ